MKLKHASTRLIINASCELVCHKLYIMGSKIKKVKCIVASSFLAPRGFLWR